MPCRRSLAARSAGRMPKASATAIETSVANARTPPSSWIRSRRGSWPSGSAASSRSPPTATATPSRPPPAASRIDSARIGRATSQRPAPSAPRTAISRRRLDSRASSRLAMFAHTMSSRNATAPSSTISAGRDAATSCSCAATTRALHRSLLSGCAAAMRPASTATSSCACASVAAGVIRPTTVSERARRDAPCMSLGSNASGVHTSTVVAVGNSNPGRHHAHHREGHGVELDWRADDRAVAAEHTGPEAVTHHHDAVGADHRFVGHEGAAQRRIGLQDGEQIGGRPDPGHVDRVAGAGVGEIHLAVGRHRLEAAAPRASSPRMSVPTRAPGCLRGSAPTARQSAPGPAYGSGLSTTALITLKMAVVAPMPSASVSSATARNVG